MWPCDYSIWSPRDLPVERDSRINLNPEHEWMHFTRCQVWRCIWTASASAHSQYGMPESILFLCRTLCLRIAVGLFMDDDGERIDEKFVFSVARTRSSWNGSQNNFVVNARFLGLRPGVDETRLVDEWIRLLCDLVILNLNANCSTSASSASENHMTR